MRSRLKLRRTVALMIMAIMAIVFIYQHESFSTVQSTQNSPPTVPSPQTNITSDAATILEGIDVKGRAPKTGYDRDMFGGKWAEVEHRCDTRNVILARDMTDIVVGEGCKVVSGVLNDPYTGNIIHFVRGEVSSQLVQIDHVVAVSNAWQTGAQLLTPLDRKAFYNDPLNLLAVDGQTNNNKGDGDAATWLPPNKLFRCQYVARQIAVKAKYSLWVTLPEKTAMKTVLSRCPGQTIPQGALGKQ